MMGTTGPCKEATLKDESIQKKDYDIETIITASGEVVLEISSAAPISSVGVITSSGEKVTKSAGPISSVGTIIAASQKVGESAAPLSSIGTITISDGAKIGESVGPILSLGTITVADGQKIGESEGPISSIGAITVADGQKSGVTFDVPACTVKYVGYWSALTEGTFHGSDPVTNEIFAAQGEYKVLASGTTLAISDS